MARRRYSKYRVSVGSNPILRTMNNEIEKSAKSLRSKIGKLEKRRRVLQSDIQKIAKLPRPVQNRMDKVQEKQRCIEEITQIDLELSELRPKLAALKSNN